LQAESTSTNGSRAAFSVESRPNRGNCLAAKRTIPQRERIVPPGNSAARSSDVWDPLVPPVLLESQRRIRCALCFDKIHQNEFVCFQQNHHPLRGQTNNPYPVLFCSEICRKEGHRLGLDQEERAVFRLYEVRGPVKIFSTAILVFRTYWITSRGGATDSGRNSVSEQISRLQCQVPDAAVPRNDKQNVDASRHHSEAVIATVVAMLQVSKDLGLVVPPKTDMEDMLQRIKMNGFSVADGESIAMGIGLYGTPSFINHSCSPNAIQTFQYGQNNRPPSLFLTAYQEIEEGREILISYLDNSCPRHLRRHRLMNDYFFFCDCQSCEDDELESHITGVKCRNCRMDSNEPVQVVHNLAPAPRTLQCVHCQETDFGKQLKSLDSFEQLDENETNVSTLERHYHELRKICWPDSWYVQEAGDRLAHAFLGKLGQASTETEQEDFASKALIVLEALMHPSSSPNPKPVSSSGEMKQAIQCFQSAKLYLFLEPDPTIAIQLLQKAQRMLRDYYPETHEILQCLAVSLGEATM